MARRGDIHYSAPWVGPEGVVRAAFFVLGSQLDVACKGGQLVGLLIRTVIAVILLLSSYGCSHSPQTPSSVVGLWFGEGYQPAAKTSMAWLMRRNEDGTFIVDFRRYQSCELVRRQVEEGHWRQEGPKYFTTTVSINGNSFHAEDEYLIEEITSAEMKYFHLNSNTHFEARRISSGVGFPLPANCSI